MTEDRLIKEVLEAMDQISDALPLDRDTAFQAVSFTLVELAAAGDITPEEVHANIDMCFSARATAARQLMS